MISSWQDKLICPPAFKSLLSSHLGCIIGSKKKRNLIIHCSCMHLIITCSSIVGGKSFIAYLLEIFVSINFCKSPTNTPGKKILTQQGHDF